MNHKKEIFPTEEQTRLDLIQNWLKRTTEEFDDWDYDGTELVIILNNQTIERYSRSDIKEFIEGF